MTVHLDWPPEVVEGLTREAVRHGLSLDAYLLQTVLQKTSTSDIGSGTEQQRLAREEAGRTILELRSGLHLGAGLTVRDLIEDGRRF